MIPFEKLKEINKITSKSVVIKQEKSPILISNFECMYEDEMTGQYGNPERLRHFMEYKNVSNTNVVAIQFGIAAFDTFNGFMGKFGGVTMGELSPNSQTKGEWSQNVYAAFLFKKYGTGVSYVSAVRAENGAIWRADMTSILQELQKFEQDLKMEDLKEPKR